MKQCPNRLFGLSALLVTCAVAFSAGCAAEYGRLNIDSTVAQSFRNSEMRDDYRYYYSGRENKPSAIIGIDPAFQFSSKYWTPIEPSQFSTMVGRMHPEYGFLYGAFMLAPDGRKAGVWYSWVNHFTAKFEGDRIIVYSPETFADVRDGSDFKDTH